DLARRGRNGASTRGVELAELAVHLRGDLLHQAEGSEEARRHAEPAHREVLDRALRLRAEQRRGRHAHLAQAVVLDAIAGRHRGLLRGEDCGFSVEWPAVKDRPRRGLVLSGGGARGAYEAGVLRYLLEELPLRLGRPARFDIITGASVGAIHACLLAATAPPPFRAGERLAAT